AGDGTVDLVIQVHGTWLRVHAGPAVEDQAVQSVSCQQRGGGYAGRSGPDDDDGDVLNGVLGQANRTAVRCVPRSMAPSSVATDASTMSPSCRYLRLPAWRVKNIFHLRVGGNRFPMSCTGFGGALSAVP